MGIKIQGTDVVACVKGMTEGESMGGREGGRGK